VKRRAILVRKVWLSVIYLHHLFITQTMKTLLVIGLCCCSILSLKAQNPVFNRSLRAAVEVVDVSDDDYRRFAGMKYSIIHTRPVFTGGRWSLESGLGYISYYTIQQYSPYPYFFKGNSSQRISTDFALLFNVLQSRRLAFRVGAGPSIWYQRNGRVSDLSGSVNGSQVESVTFNRMHSNDFNVGINLRSDLEYKVSPRIIVGARAGVIGSLTRQEGQGSLLGTLTTLGLSIGYRF